MRRILVLCITAFLLSSCAGNKAEKELAKEEVVEEAETAARERVKELVGEEAVKGEETAARERIEERAKQIVSVRFEDAHIRTVLKQLCEVSGISMVVDETIFPGEGEEVSPAARVTIQLEDVPLIKALDVILRPKGLSYRIVGNVIWIATAENLADMDRMAKEGSE